MARPILAEIDLHALRGNLLRARERAPGTQVLAVVKADAYGHGLTRVLPALSQADGLALLELDAAVALRDARYARRILLLEGFFEPGELEEVVRGLTGHTSPDLLVGLDDGDDAAVVRVDEHTAVVATADFFTPVVDSAYDWGRIAAANALSDVYAMGGRPVVAVNLVGWPRSVLPTELLTEVLRGGLDVAREAACPVAGGHSIDDPEPKYGMAVTGVADPDRLMRNDAGRPGVPLTLTKPLGIGVLNSRHKNTGVVSEEAVASMTALNREAGQAAVAAGIRAGTDVTGFGLLGHLYKMARASGVTAVVDAAAVPYLAGAREALAAGFALEVDAHIDAAFRCRADQSELLRSSERH